MSEKIQKKFLLFSHSLLSKFFIFSIYYKYDRKVVLLIFEKEGMGEREKRAVESSPPFSKQKRGEI